MFCRLYIIFVLKLHDFCDRSWWRKIETMPKEIWYFWRKSEKNPIKTLKILDFERQPEAKNAQFVQNQPKFYKLNF